MHLLLPCRSDFQRRLLRLFEELRPNNNKTTTTTTTTRWVLSSDNMFLIQKLTFSEMILLVQSKVRSFGLIENGGHENDGLSKLADMKLQDTKMAGQKWRQGVKLQDKKCNVNSCSSWAAEIINVQYAGFTSPPRLDCVVWARAGELRPFWLDIRHSSNRSSNRLQRSKQC